MSELVGKSSIMNAPNKITFTIEGSELEKLNQWMKTKNLKLYSGAIGGRFTYSFTPTSIGVGISVTDGLEQKDTINLTDYESW